MNDIETVIDAVSDLIRTRGYVFTMDGVTQPFLTPRQIAAPDCLLPVLGRLAEELWRQETGNGFGLLIEPDPEALADHRLTAIHHAPLSLVVLCMDEVLRRVGDGGSEISLEGLHQYATALYPRTHPQPPAP